MKLLSKRILILLAAFAVVGLIKIGTGSGQGPADGTPEARASALQELLGSTEGRPREAPRVFKAPEGYLRFVGAPPSTYFPVDPNRRVTPQEAAGAFLEKNRNLFVNVSPAVDFETLRVDTRDSRTYVRYQQTFAGLKVFGAEMVVQVNAAGGIDAVMSDIMRDTEVLDTEEVSLNPTIDLLTAEGKAIEWLAAQHKQLEFEASTPTLMIFDPPVVGWEGQTQLVWHIDVTNVGELQVQEFILVDAHNGKIAFNYSRICYGLYRRITDYDTSIEYTEESSWPTEIEDVDLAYEYLEDTWYFFKNHHGRDGYNDKGADTKATVHYPGPGGTRWRWTHMTIEDEMVVDDIVGHEFAHGVSDTNPCHLGYTHNEAGAINEMFSDIWGEFIDQENLVSKTGNDQPADKWKLFEDLGEGAWRNMKDPPLSEHGPAPAILYGEHWYSMEETECPEAPQGENEGKYCFTHRNNGVGNKLCYLLTDGDTFNGHTVWGMEIPTVSDLFYESQYILTSQCDYYDLYYALTQAAINCNLSWEERVNVKEGCEAVEICPAEDVDDWVLEAHWKLDEGEGTIAYDSAGNNDGTLVGDPTWYPTGGKIDGALDFDGDDYVELDHAIDALKGRTATISAWVNRDNVAPDYLPIVTQYSEGKGYYFCLHNGKPALYLESWAESKEVISAGEWHHVAGTYNNYKLKIFVDGFLKADPELYKKKGEDCDAYIGFSGGTSYFEGLIDDVRVYNWALSKFEIWDAMSGDAPRFRVKNSSDETVAWFDSFGNLCLKGTFTSGEEIDTAPSGSFIIASTTDPTVAYIDNEGNMCIEGDWSELSGSCNPEGYAFIIKNSSDANVAYIDFANGDLCLTGKLYRNSEQ